MEMLHAKDVAEQLNVTTNRVYALIGEGVIPAVRFGRAVRIPKQAWEEWLAEQVKRATGGRRTAKEVTAR